MWGRRPAKGYHGGEEAWMAPEDKSCGESHGKIGTGDPGKQRRYGKVLGGVRRAEKQTQGPQGRLEALGNQVGGLPLRRGLGQTAERTS